MTLRLVALLAVSAATTAVTSAAPAAAQQLSLAERRAVDSVFSRIDRSDTPGCVVGVSRQGAPVYVRGYGMSDLQHRIALGPRSIFHVASISKQFTALSVALLAEEGKLSLDDDIRTHVPEVPDHGARITLRQLIHHTSGLRDQWSLLAYAGWRGDDLITEEDVLDIVSRQRGVNFAPGEEYLYSNTGYTLLAVVVKRVSGKSLREFAQERFFGPLGMRDTHFHDDHTMLVPGRTSAYQPRGGLAAAVANGDGTGAWRISIPVFDTYGATSLFTTAEDLLRWMAFLDAPSVGTPKLWSAAITSATLNNGAETGYGYGLAVGRWRGQRVIGHAGADAGYRANAERFPDHGLAIAILCNRADANPAGLSRLVAEALLRGRIPMEMVNARAFPHRASAEALAQWVGTYRDTVSQAVLRLTVSGDSLFSNGQHLALGSDTTAPSPDGSGYLALRRRGDGRMTLVREPRGMRQVVLVRQEPPVAARAFGDYAGAYYSTELDTRYDIVLRDSALVRRHRKLGDATLAAAGRDLFTYGGTTVLFTRDRRGRVTGFTISQGRVRGVRFERVP